MMNSEGMIELLKQALLYYADERVYKVILPADGKEISSIMNDGGFQAKFALKQLEDQEKAEADMNIDWTNFKEPETNLEDITQIIKDNLNK